MNHSHTGTGTRSIYDAFNKGWKNAVGEWVYYLGSDDALTYEGIYEQMKVVDEASSKIGVINGGVIRVNTDNKQKPESRELSDVFDEFTGLLSSQQGLMFDGVPLNDDDRSKLIDAIKVVAAIAKQQHQKKSFG